MEKILVFKSTTCGPCKMLTPVLERVQSEIELDITEYYIDQSDEARDYAMSYGVSSVPTIVKPDTMETLVGLRRKKDIVEWLTA